MWSMPSCPKCEEARKLAEANSLGPIRKEKKQEQVEIEKRQARRDYAFSRSSVPIRFKNASFDSFLPQCDDSKKCKSICEDYALNFPEYLRNGTCMIFCGTAGTGKTHLAISIIREIIYRYDYDANYTKASDALRLVKSTYAKSSKMTEDEAIKSFSKCSLLVIDEIGVQFASEAEKMILFEIVNSRYEKMLPTILISNLAIPAMTDCVGERVIDRMKENGGKSLVFNWKSKRGHGS